MLMLAEFLSYLTRYGVNCVVDIRQTQLGKNLGDYEAPILREELKNNGIQYLSFKNDLLSVELLYTNGNGHSYEKIVLDENFQNSMSRLTNGQEKGYNIVLLGSNLNPANDFRTNIIGRYLSEQNWTVLHILIDGSILSQEELIDKSEQTKEQRVEQKKWNEHVGTSGEEIAALYLIQKGYTILDCNWNLHRGCELDIVAFKDNILHAIEVKTRKSDFLASPEQAINDAKLRNINKALSEYRYRNKLTNIPYQVDSIAIVMRSETDYTIKMFENIVRRTKRYYR